MMKRISRRIEVFAAAIATAAGFMVGSAGSIDARPIPSLPAPHRVDQLGDFVYEQLFAVGVQVYELVETRRQTVYAPQPVANYIPVLRRLHLPRDGKRGILRYGFIGSRCRRHSKPRARCIDPRRGSAGDTSHR